VERREKSALPKFQSRPITSARRYIHKALTRGGDLYLRDLIAYDDGHFRAVFDKGYFMLAEGVTEPTKSQWSTFKKHLKRVDPHVFIFKAHGYTPCGEENADCCYVDFGFLAD
jgi:hypothetical protein